MAPVLWSRGPILCPMALSHVLWPCPMSYDHVLCPMPLRAPNHKEKTLIGLQEPSIGDVWDTGHGHTPQDIGHAPWAIRDGRWDFAPALAPKIALVGAMAPAILDPGPGV